MYGDFSLDPFAERPGTARVLMQQGRVLLDADWNAQVAASTSLYRRFAIALLGPWAGEGDAFKIGGSGAALTIAQGTYWVSGLPVTNGPNITIASQPVYNALEALPPALNYPVLLYIDAWEQMVSVNEDESLREVALGGPDTTLRSEIRWAVRALHLEENEMSKFTATTTGTPTAKSKAKGELETFLSTFFDRFSSTATLTAEAAHHDTTDACLVAPDAKYRGVENQLYRVEVFRGTHDAFGNPILNADGTPLPPLLVWSRDNGSVTLPVATVDGTSVEVTFLGRDDRTRLQAGSLVQVVDRYDAAAGRPRPLTKVADVSDYRNLVTLRDAVAVPKLQPPAILRRWDGGPVELDLTKSEIEIDLENDIVVTMRNSPGLTPRLRTGDYWIIPARTALGDVIWPKETNGALRQLPPQGVAHRFAPLAAASGSAAAPIDVRTVIQRPVTMV